jgi:histone H3/H4
MLGTPAILQRPDLITGASGSAAGASSGVLGQSNNWDELLGVPLRDSKGSNAFDSRLAAMSGEELANEMANPDFWDQMSGRGTGADSLLNSGSASAAGSAAALAASSNGRLLSKRKVQELVGEIDPSERLEGAVEDLLLEIADEFIDSVAQFACRLAKHRKGERLEVRDVQLHLERSWNLRIPTPGSMPIPPPRIKPATQSSAGKGNAAAAAANN